MLRCYLFYGILSILSYLIVDGKEKVVVQYNEIKSGQSIAVPALINANSEFNQRDGNARPSGQFDYKSMSATPRLIYQCEDGGIFQVEFAPRGESVLLILPGKRLHLPAAPAASGAKYSDGQNTFWTKGDEAILELDGKIRYRGCRRQQE